jgi:hypothetical protein
MKQNSFLSPDVNLQELGVFSFLSIDITLASHLTFSYIFCGMNWVLAESASFIVELEIFCFTVFTAFSITCVYEHSVYNLKMFMYLMN